jgi:hypothetical protein
MSCNHPQTAWVGKADGIYCGQCGAKIEPGKPAPKTDPVKAEKKAPEPEAKKPAPKKGGTKGGKSK